MLRSILLVAVAFVAPVFARPLSQRLPLSASTSTSSSADCHASDSNLQLLWSTLCSSLSGPLSCPGTVNVTAQGDWPNQVIYMKNLLDAIAAPSTCLNTSYSHDLVGWLNVTNTTTNAWWNTWMVFQVQYYDMPRQPGARIESPATLGRKCWAFAYLAQAWPALRPKLIGALSSAGLDMDPFVEAYDAAVPFTLNICDQVMANCFVNATYDPVARNGTCPDGVGQFFVGFQWENGQRNNSVSYEFPVYTQTNLFHNDAIFAVNTALNFII
eukprot:INCI9092.1.p1 GENE.INCI9092.1~~INCI9092.1.p1  ORF type:complete len:270 (-),score=30.95 INCI9092.1:84-893(-)